MSSTAFAIQDFAAAANTAAEPPTLRPYLIEAVTAIRAAFARWRRVLFVLPTGGGKTVCFALITSNAAASPPWAQGIDIRHARGWQWFQLLQHADGDPTRLRQIQVVLGYKAGWTRYAVQEAAEKRAAAQRRAA